MDIQTINQHKTEFDAIMQCVRGDNGKEEVEVWFARELQGLLGYARWENFLVAIKRATESCKSQNVNVDDHFREVTKMVTLGSGAPETGVAIGDARPTEDVGETTVEEHL